MRRAREQAGDVGVLDESTGMTRPVELRFVSKFVSISLAARGTAVEAPRRERSGSVGCKPREPMQMGCPM
eukprot:3596287-Pleurochrysis_carterae.AAC.2